MAKKTGTQSRAVYALGSTFDTAVAGGAGDRLRGTITPSITNQELIKNPIGSGLVMQDETQKGRVSPVVTLASDLGFQNGFDKVLAQFFGATTAPAEQTPSQSDYLHRFTLNPVENVRFGTLAYELTTTDVAEYPSCATRSITTSFDATQQYMQISAELLANDIVFDSAINTNLTIAAATFVDQECVRVKEADEFLINLQSDGAFDSNDRYKILSYNRTLTRPQEQMGGVRGAAGNSAPVVTDIITGTLTVTLEALETIGMFEAWRDETYFKSSLIIEGTQIGTGDNKSYTEFNPRMKLVSAPEYALANAGYNTVTLNFTLFEAASNPTGMNSTRPYLEIVNGQSTQYIS